MITKKMDIVSVKRNLIFKKHFWMKVLRSLISKFLLKEVKDCAIFHLKVLNLYKYSES